MKCLFIHIFSLLLSLNVFSQASDWKLIQTYPIKKDAVWTVDVVGNVISANRDHLTKYNPTGTIIFEQSQKSIGRIDKIEPVNTLKFVAFSEEQQTLCFFDNSLTIMENCIELEDFDVLNATQFATSGQSDKLWVFDQVNSTLSLLSLNGLNQEQEVKNLMGILNAESIVQMIEIENKLFFVDSEKGVFVVDLYGTLIRYIEMDQLKWVQFKEDNVLMLVGGDLIIYNFMNEQQAKIALPSFDFSEFIFDGKAIFFRSPESIQKFEFLLVK